jgi:hypothetical protein
MGLARQKQPKPRTATPGAEEFETGAAIHLALDHFEPVDLAFDLARARGVSIAAATPEMSLLVVTRTTASH